MIGAALISAVGTVVGLTEPQLVGFILNRMPTDNPLTRRLLTVVEGTSTANTIKKKKKKN